MRTAESSDLERMLDLAEAKRDLYRVNAHPFQRPANDARTLQRPFFEGLLGRDDFIVLVHDDAERRHGPCSQSCRLRPSAKTYGPCS